MGLQFAMERGPDVPAQEIRHVEVSDSVSDCLGVIQTTRGSSAQSDSVGP